MEIVPGPRDADLIWDLPSGDVLTAQGDVAARLGPAREARTLRGLVEKWRLLRALGRNIDGTLGARIRPDDRVYRNGERLSLEPASERDGRLILFDLIAVRAESVATAAKLVGLLRTVHGRPFEISGVEALLAELGSAAVVPASVYTGP